MALSCGIVGLPNVGKSTLFNCLTQAHAEAANYPFCTIEPNIGIVNVPDPRLDALASVVHPERILPAAMTFVDIAGLVRGANKGEGLGNQFLSHIRDVDAIVHVVRCFTEDNVIHVDGDINPVRDVETVETELLLKDCETVEKQADRFAKNKKNGNALAIKLHDFASVLLNHMQKGNLARTLSLEPYDDDVHMAYRDMHLLTAKPTVFLANVDEDTLQGAENTYLKALEGLAGKRGDGVVPVCAKIESELLDLKPEERKEFLESMGLNSSGLERVIRAAYKLLGLSTYLTAGVKEVRAWTIKQGMKAPQAAGVIHSDFERGFIKAQVIWWEDFVKHGGEAGCRTNGLLRLEGKDYIVKDGDVMNFKFNV